MKTDGLLLLNIYDDQKQSLLHLFMCPEAAGGVGALLLMKSEAKEEGASVFIRSEGEAVGVSAERTGSARRRAWMSDSNMLAVTREPLPFL